MKKTIFLCLITCLLFSFSLLGQRETSNWYFGNGAGIQFNTDGSVTALEDGKINTFEGCASISNEQGNLLFYTDGTTVYNSEHKLMQNGAGLYGDSSSTQSAIVVPKPEDPNILYIFTVDSGVSSANDTPKGLNYSIVDMTEDNGLGAITDKNINLLKFSSEKIAAVVKDCLDKSLWVITLSTQNGSVNGFTDTYHAFEVNTSGVNKNSITSTFSNIPLDDPRGYLKISANGNKIASANATSGLYLYDFDIDTGIVTNPEKLRLYDQDSAPYGIEFSPNQEFLYVHSFRSANDERNITPLSYLLQYDLAALNIDNSMVLLDQREIFRGALQLGENGKIYRTISVNYDTGTSYLGVIHNPDEKGTTSNYEHNAIYLNGKNAMQGLPPFIQSFFEKTTLVKNEDNRGVSYLEVCAEEDLSLDSVLYPDATYTWKKDDITLPYTGNKLQLNDLNISDSGKYTLDIVFNDPYKCPIIGEAKIEVLESPTNETYTLTQCDTEIPLDGFSTFNLEEAFYDSDNTYFLYETEIDRSNDNPIDSSLPYNNTTSFNQTLYYTTINSNECENYGVLNLVITPTTISNTPDYNIFSCANNPEEEDLKGTFSLMEFSANNYSGMDVSYYNTITDLQLEQNEIASEITTNDTFIYARIEVNNQCQTVDLISLIVNPTPIFEYPEEFILCTDGKPIELYAPNGFDSYSWSRINGSEELEISTNETTFISDVGTYRIKVGYEYNNGGTPFFCTSFKDITILPSNKAVIENIEIEDGYTQNSINVTVSGDGEYEYSLDNFTYQISPNFTDVLPGNTIVYVKDLNGCGIVSKEIEVIGFPSFFTPNNDSYHDTWNIAGLSANNLPNSTVHIFNRYGNLIKQLDPLGDGWDGSFNGKPLPSSDYWYKAILENGRTLTGHFTLKR